MFDNTKYICVQIFYIDCVLVIKHTFDDINKIQRDATAPWILLI